MVLFESWIRIAAQGDIGSSRRGDAAGGRPQVDVA